LLDWAFDAIFRMMRCTELHALNMTSWEGPSGACTRQLGRQTGRGQPSIAS